MKKIIFFSAALVVGVLLTSFVLNKETHNKNEMPEGWSYYTTVTGWDAYDPTESKTFKIYYKQGNGVRKYAAEFWGGYQIVTENSYRGYSDYRGKYRYQAGNYLFNANLPYMAK